MCPAIDKHVFWLDHLENRSKFITYAEMVGSIEIVSTIRSWSEQWHGFIVETLVGRCKRQVRTIVDAARINVPIGGHIGDVAQKIVHKSGLTFVADLLQDVRVEERPTDRHVVHMQQIGTVRKHRVNAEIFDVRYVRDRVCIQKQIIHINYLAVVSVHSVHFLSYPVEVIVLLPIKLAFYTLDKKK